MASSAAPNSKKLALGFTLRFFGLIFLITALARVDTVLLDHVVGRALTERSAALVTGAFSILGEEARRSGNTIYYSGAAFRVVDECTGIEVMALFAAAVLAFPSAWRHRLLGLAIGIPGLVVLNWIRMISLVWVGSSSHRALEIGHVYIWPTIILTVALGLWLYWARIATRDVSPVV